MTTIVVNGDKPTLQVQLSRLADEFVNAPAGTLVEAALYAEDLSGAEIELRFTNARQTRPDLIEVEVL